MATSQLGMMQHMVPTRFDELKAAGHLPTPTGVALAILRLADSDRASVSEITRVLESDPAMAGRILKLANSALSGALRRVPSVRDAVTRLGVRAVRNTALCFSVLSQSRNRGCKQFDYNRYWSRSLATGVAAQAASAQVQRVSADEAFTCGLLCQVGALALASIYPTEYGSILEQCQDGNGSRLIDLEHELLAIDHNELTAAMLADWGLPDACVQAAGVYERADTRDLTPGSGAESMARLLSLAAQLADVCVAEDERRSSLLPALFTYAETLGISVPDLILLGDRLADEWHEWGKILNVPTMPVTSFADLSERSRQSAPGDALAITPVDFATARPRSRPAVPNAHSDAEAAVEADRAGSSSASLNILAVVADPNELRVLTKCLTAVGHRVITARNGNEALRLVFETAPHLVVTDWIMPELDGLAFCKALRQTKIGQETYIILLTGDDREEQLIEALEAGADDYIVKPVKPRPLVARIRAGHRVVQLQQEVQRDKEELRRYMGELAVANRKLQQDAFTDALTGLPNRRYALKRLEEEWTNSIRTRQPLACMIADIDYFKAVNDTFGHDVGDVVIRETATVMTYAFRTSDAVCRLGGEEFLIVCPNAELTTATACAERMRVQVADNVIRTTGYEGNVTVSVGVAARLAGMHQISDLLKAADLAVYQAKQSGRNRVRTASS